MAIFTLRWQVAGDVQLKRALINLATDISDARTPLRRAGDQVIYPATRRQFAQEGDPAWPELKPAYAARKARVAPAAKILHLTGAMEESLTDKDAADAVYRLEKLSLEIGSDVRVGQYSLPLIHYAPITAPVPPRRMMRLGTSEQTRIITIFDEWLNEQMRRQGVLL